MSDYVSEAENKTVVSGLTKLAEDFTEAKEYVGKGWHTLLDILHHTAKHIWISDGVFISIEQVKEKFGGLRFYYVTQMIPELHPSLYQEGKRVGWRYKQSYDAGKIVGGKYADSVTIYDADRSMRRAADHFDGAVSLAESLSVRMCEECGNKAEVRPGKTSTWLKCYCDNCLNKGN